jgi:hypothetical protein
MSTRYDEDREKAERDPCRDEAIFDGGCARFVPKEDRTLAFCAHRSRYGRAIAVGPAREARHIGCDRFGVFSRRPARFLVLYQKNTLPKFWR